MNCISIEEAKMKALMKNLKATALAVLALGLLSTSGCDRHSTKEVFYMVAANQALPPER